MEEKNNIYMFLRSKARKMILDILGSYAEPAPGIHILNGHRINSEKEPETFRRLLEELSKKVEFIKVEDAVQMILRKEQPQKPMVAFTFDDGFMDCYNYFAPVLEQFNTNALFFINPNYVEGNSKYIEDFNKHIVLTSNKQPMRWEHLRELADRGHLIGAHTMDHYEINSNDIDALKYQIIDCKKDIEDNLGKPCDYFAFPYGKLSQASPSSINMACNAYKYVFSQSDYKNYFSFNGRVINRRHFEPFWPLKHIYYFLSCHKKY
jgi:peptidoglycan/xylan/chitin deacetylase (PgdA/CDA1 family)